MTRQCISPADLKREALALKNSAHPELVEGRAPNQREFGINDDYAGELFRPEPSMLPNFLMTRHNRVERDDG